MGINSKKNDFLRSQVAGSSPRTESGKKTHKAWISNYNKLEDDAS